VTTMACTRGAGAGAGVGGWLGRSKRASVGPGAAETQGLARVTRQLDVSISGCRCRALHLLSSHLNVSPFSPTSTPELLYKKLKLLYK
jgi:hypothetical protein